MIIELTFDILKKIKYHILKILVTALLESIDLFIAIFNEHDKLNNVDLGQAYKYVQENTQTKSNPTKLQHYCGINS